MTGRMLPRPEWQPAARVRDVPQEHRCGLCFGPYGKSAIRCKNEPEPIPKEKP